MKIVIALGVAAAISLSAMGADNALAHKDAEESAIIRYCTGFADISGLIMAARQDEVGMAEMYAMTDKGTGLLPVINKAYNQRAYLRKEDKLRAVAAFKNAMFRDCVKEIKGA